MSEISPLRSSPFIIEQEKSKQVTAPITPTIEFRQPEPPPLKGPPELALIQAMLQMEKARASYQMGNEQAQKKSEAELGRLRSERSMRIQENAKALESVNTWSGLTELASLFASASYVGEGALLAPANPIMSGMLIAAGVLGVANSALHHYGVWDELAEKYGRTEEEREQLKWVLPAMMAAVSHGLALTAGVSLMNRATSIIEGTTNVGKAKSEYHLANSKTDIQRLDFATQTQESARDAIMKRMTESMQAFAHMSNASHEILNEMIRVNQYISAATAA